METLSQPQVQLTELKASKTPPEDNQRGHHQNVQYQTDFGYPDEQRNSRSVNHISKPETPLEQPWPSQEIKLNSELCTFQHDFSDLAIKQQIAGGTFASLDSNPSSFRVARPPLKTTVDNGTMTQQTA